MTIAGASATMRFDSVVQAEQHAHGDRARDQRIAVVARHAHGIARQELRLHVARDEEIAAQLVHEREPVPRERHVQLDLERGRGEHHAADARRVVVHPRGGEHGADALRDDGEILHREAVRVADVIGEGLQVADQRGTPGASPRGPGERP